MRTWSNKLNFKPLSISRNEYCEFGEPLRWNTWPHAPSTPGAPAAGRCAAALRVRVHILVLSLLLVAGVFLLLLVAGVSLLVARVRDGLRAEEHLPKEAIGLVVSFVRLSRRLPRRPGGSTYTFTGPLFMFLTLSALVRVSFGGTRCSARRWSRRLAVSRLSLSRPLWSLLYVQ